MYGIPGDDHFEYTYGAAYESMRPGGEGYGFSGMNHSPEARREERLFQKLSAEGRYAELDKAKHNEQYKNYLLENFEEF